MKKPASQIRTMDYSKLSKAPSRQRQEEVIQQVIDARNEYDALLTDKPAVPVSSLA